MLQILWMISLSGTTLILSNTVTTCQLFLASLRETTVVQSNCAN